MTLDSPLNYPPLKPESSIDLDFQYRLKLKTGDPGQKCTDCGLGYPDVQFGARRNTFGHFYFWRRCTGCHAAQVRSRRHAEKKHFGVANGIRDCKPPVGTPCDCCGEPMTHKGKRAMHFDHDHETDTFRGWLDKQCNTGIGQLGDTIQGLVKALLYLLRTTELTDTHREVLRDLKYKLDEIIN